MERKSEHIYNEWLVIRAQQGETEAFQELIEMWYQRLFSYTFRLTGSKEATPDLVQDALLVVSKKLRTLRDPATFPNWVYQIVSFKCRDWIRKQQRNRIHTETFIENKEELEYETKTDDQLLIKEALEKLEAPYYEVIRLFYMEEFSVSEISSLLEIPVGTVKSRLFNARKLLKSILKGEIK